MTSEQREFHERMSGEISAALANLRHEFDIQPRDMDLSDEAELQIIQGNLKAILLKAYARNHTWISEG